MWRCCAGCGNFCRSAGIVADMRNDGRANDQLRPVKVTRGFTQTPAGSVLWEQGKTIVLCTASVTQEAPPVFKASRAGGDRPVEDRAAHDRAGLPGIAGGWGDADGLHLRGVGGAGGCGGEIAEV